ncbi:MAG TPA: HAD hydrolase family protein, partial [Lachnospiraceae bacterium]|nr:HAD hydrolase family protein [Lachnospiraceae bacterium]
MNTKVLVLDIDGTLTNSQKDITIKTKEAIHLIQEQGHIVMLASGRPTPGMTRYAKELELEKYGGYLISFNGGNIINCRTGEVVYQKTLPNYIIPGLFRFAKEKDCGICTYLGDHIIVGTRMDQYLELESRMNGMPWKEVKNFDKYIDFDVNKCLLTAEPVMAVKYES